MSRPAVRDLIVPGSLRHVVVHEEWDAVTIRCGRCGSEHEARAESKTTRCKSCDRVCRMPQDGGAGPNVVPLRRRSA